MREGHKMELWLYGVGCILAWRTIYGFKLTILILYSPKSEFYSVQIFKVGIHVGHCQRTCSLPPQFT